MKIAILGSTGSIGTSTLEVVKKYPEQYEVVALAAGRNADVMAEQIRRFSPRLVSLACEETAARLKSAVGDLGGTEILCGDEGASSVATCADADMVIAAISGSAGLLPTLAAVRAGKDVALANKESLVMAGEVITAEARRRGSKLIPVDSEHSAVFQLLNGRQAGQEVRSIILTASGGPFLGYDREALSKVTLREALNHPRWKMGNKVTIDSASLMNKGLEIIEARWLFDLAPEKLKVVVHPQSIVHSMVEFVDGCVFAQLSNPDMKGPIAYALSCPERLPDIVEPIDLARVGQLTFLEPDTHSFPSLRLAYDALAAGGLMPAVMNAANEVAVKKFCDQEIAFVQMPEVVAGVMERFDNRQSVDLDAVLWADEWARREAQSVLKQVV